MPAPVFGLCPVRADQACPEATQLHSIAPGQSSSDLVENGVDDLGNLTRRAASDKPAKGASLARRLHITLYYVGTVMPATLLQLFSHCMRVRSHERTPRQSRRLCPDHRAVIY